jgi:hypothetical protein
VVFDALGACQLAGYSATVFLTNLFLMPPSLDDFLALPHETFDTPEEVFAAGWIVDRPPSLPASSATTDNPNGDKP